MQPAASICHLIRLRGFANGSNCCISVVELCCNRSLCVEVNTIVCAAMLRSCCPTSHPSYTWTRTHCSLSLLRTCGYSFITWTPPTWLPWCWMLRIVLVGGTTSLLVTRLLANWVSTRVWSWCTSRGWGRHRTTGPQQWSPFSAAITRCWCGATKTFSTSSFTFIQVRVRSDWFNDMLILCMLLLQVLYATHS